MSRLCQQSNCVWTLPGRAVDTMRRRIHRPVLIVSECGVIREGRGRSLGTRRSGSLSISRERSQKEKQHVGRSTCGFLAAFVRVHTHSSQLLSTLFLCVSVREEVRLTKTQRRTSEKNWRWYTRLVNSTFFTCRHRIGMWNVDA